MNKYLEKMYHGSPTPDMEQIDPRNSEVLGGERAVFGTPNRDVAISFLVPWNDGDFRQGSHDGQMYMRENAPGNFEKFFKGKSGHIYSLDPAAFDADPRLTGFERIARGSQKVQSKERVDDALEELRKSNFTMLKYQETAPWEKASEQKRSEPKEHQNRILAKLDQNSVIAAHSMGSGKTLTALLAAEKAHKDFPHEHVTAIVPASLVTNMKEQIAQHGVSIDPERFETITYDKAVNDLKRLQGKNHSLIIVDEAHRLRNKDTKRSTELNKLLKSSRKNLLLTGTPSYNKPEDIAVLVNQAAGAKVLPDTGKDFEDKFIGRRKVSPGFMAEHVLGVKPGEVTYLKNQGELRDALKKYVDTYDAQTTNAEDFPTQTHKTVKVNMDKDQKRIYKFLEDDIPAPVRWKIRLGLPLNKKESADLNSFSTGVRQASNNIRPYVKNPHEAGISPKQKRMADSIQERVGTDKNYRGISYSNYLESGLRPLHEELTNRGIQSAIFDGSLSQKEKDKLVERYNSGDLKHMMVSSSGSEGLNLKGTKLVQIMEPHFNKSKIDQMVARGVRYKSHEHLPHEERHVDVEHYHSVMEPGMVDKILGQKTKTIDEYLSDMSDSKEKVKNDIMNLVKTASNKYLEKIASDYDRASAIQAGLVGTAMGGGMYGAQRATDGYMASELKDSQSRMSKLFAEKNKITPNIDDEKSVKKVHDLQKKILAERDVSSNANKYLKASKGTLGRNAAIAGAVGVAGSALTSYLGKEAQETTGADIGVDVATGAVGSALMEKYLAPKIPRIRVGGVGRAAAIGAVISPLVGTAMRHFSEEKKANDTVGDPSKLDILAHRTMDPISWAVRAESGLIAPGNPGAKLATLVGAKVVREMQKQQD